MLACIELVGEIAKKRARVSVLNRDEIGDSRKSWPSVGASYICIF